MGGRENSEWGEYYDWWNPGSPDDSPKQGLIFKDEWPWGVESPDEMPNIDEYAITPFGKFSSPQGVGLTNANNFGIYDMIGNVREYTNHWEKGYLWEWGSPPLPTRSYGSGWVRIQRFRKSPKLGSSLFRA